MKLVVGVDAGGSNTSAVVATTDGEVVGRGRAGGANQRSSGGSVGGPVGAALTAALGELPRGDVVGGHIGVAGAGRAGWAVAAREVAETWTALSLPGSPELSTDLEVAFAAGTPESTGLLLAAGTGAIAAAVSGGYVAHRCDGYGWLLGDEGSAVWLGVEGLRAVLRSLDGRAPRTSLTTAISRLLLGSEAPTDDAALAQALLGAGYKATPAELGRLAPLVSRCATNGNATALRLTGAAAARLLAAVETAARSCPEAATAGLVVLAGSVLCSPGPVASVVRAGIRERFGSDAVLAGDGAGGAAGLALRQLTGTPPTAQAHARLTERPLPVADEPLARWVRELRHGAAPASRSVGAEQLREESRKRTITRPRGPELPIVQDLATTRGTGLRLYRPVAAPRPIVVFAHGGGFVIGDLDSHDRICRRLAQVANATVLAVDYRLAPEHPAPAAIDDIIEAFQWAGENLADIGGAPGLRVGLAGDSEGGTLALLAALRLRGTGPLGMPSALLLAYPSADLTLAQPSVEQEGSGWGLRPTSCSGSSSNGCRIRSTVRTRHLVHCSPNCPACRPRSSPPPSTTRCATRETCWPSGCVPPVWKCSMSGTRDWCTASLVSTMSLPLLIEPGRT